MAEITDKTIQDLNKLLQRLADDQGSDKTTDTPARARSRATRPGGDLASEEKALERAKEKVEDLEQAYKNLGFSIEREYQQKAAKAEEKLATDRRTAAADLEMQQESAREQFEKSKKNKRDQDRLDKKLASNTEKYAAKIKNLNKAYKNTNKQLGAEEGLTQNLSRLGTQMLGLEVPANSMTMQMFKIGEVIQKAKDENADMEEVMKNVKKQMKMQAAMKAIQLVEAGLKKMRNTIAGLVTAQDEAISSFRTATGASKQYNLEITGLERRTFEAGVTSAQAAKAFGTLYEQFSGFTELSETERGNLAETTVLLEKLGVDAGSSAKIMDQLSRSLGYGPDALGATVRKLAGSAKSLGVSMKKMSADFQSSFKELSKYGANAENVFLDLAKQAKATGIEVGTLMGYAKQFDTFDGAAKSVGRLNAIMGGPYLNSIDMLNASEAERIDLLKSSVDASGIQFDAMNRFEKQAMAAALGMSVEDASRIMKMSTAEMQLQTMEQEALADQAQEVQTMLGQIKSAMMAMAIDMRPFIEDVVIPMVKGFGKAAKFIGSMVDRMNTFGKVMAVVSIALAAALVPMAGAVMLATGGLGWPIAGAMLAAAGVSAAGGAMAGGMAWAADSPGEGGSAGGGSRRPDTMLARGGLVNLGPKKSAALKAGSRRPDMMLAPGGEVNPEPAQGGGSFLEKLYAAVGLNEHGPETAVLPYGTYVTNAADTKESINMATAVVAELKGLREDISRGGTQRVMLTLDDGQEFAASIVNASGMTPFG